MLLTSFLSDDFYRSGQDTINRIVELTHQMPEFAAKAAVYARNVHGMRSVSHVVAGEVVEVVKGEPWTKDFISQVVRRPDDMTEILSYRAAKYGIHPMPNSLKKGLGLAFGKFDAYQLAKYQARDKQVSLVDVMNLVRPKPTHRNGEALAAMAKDALRSTETWEAKLSSGQNKAEAWEELLSDGKLGYFALLRNLRNILKTENPRIINMGLEQLQNREAIHKSLVLPFRFYTAYRTLGADTDLNPVTRNWALAALSSAADIAVSNMPEMDGTTLIALDTSGSMKNNYVSGRSEMTVAQLGALFAVAMYKKNPMSSFVLTFDTQATQPPINPNDSLLTITDNIVRGMRGGGTDMDLVFQHSQPVDRVIVLSDMQAWTNGEWGDSWTYNKRHGYGWVGRQVEHKPAQSALDEYKKRTGANPKVFSLDLKGYGSLQFPQQNCYQLAGWSEKVFDLMRMLEEDRNAMVNEVEKIQF